MPRQVFAVRFRNANGNMTQREFERREDAQPLIDRLKRNVQDYQVIRAWQPTLMERLMEAKLRWLGYEVYVVQAVLSTALTAALVALSLYVLGRMGVLG